MFDSLFSFLTPSHPQYVRNMGYLDEARAMKKRSVRNRAAWQSHLEKTRSFVLSSAEKCRSRGKVVVLGAGLLLDVPLEELARLFREVVLLDIVLLPEVRRAIRTFGNVRVVQRDVTNAAERLYENVLHGRREFPRPQPAVPEIDESADLAVSLNILSQVWVIPRAYALRTMPGVDEETVEDWSRQIVESHHTFLKQLRCSVCLVADHEFIRRDHGGNVVSRGSTVFGLALPHPDVSWGWDIVPAGNDNRLLSKELIVGAWHFGRRS